MDDIEIGLTVVGGAVVLTRFSSDDAIRGIVLLHDSIVGPTALDAKTTTLLLLLLATGLLLLLACWTAVSRPSTRRVGNGV